MPMPKRFPGEKRGHVVRLQIQQVTYSITVMSETGRLIFAYIDRLNDFGFTTSLLCEQGEPYIPAFKALLKSEGIEVERGETDGWIYDRARNMSRDQQ